MGYKNTRVFGGKRYQVFAMYDNKRDAKSAGKRAKATGAKIRILKSKSTGGWVLYVHGRSPQAIVNFRFRKK